MLGRAKDVPLPDRAYASVQKAKLKRRTTPGPSSGDGEFTAGIYQVSVVVTPAVGQPFEAEFRFNAEIPPLIPHVGGQVPVRYDAERRVAEWDEQTARDDHARQAAFDRRRREELAAERRATGQPEPGTDGPDPELMAELQALQARLDSGELNDWQFRQERAEIMKRRGF